MGSTLVAQATVSGRTPFTRIESNCSSKISAAATLLQYSETRCSVSITGREYHRWYSSRLGRDMELLVFGHAGARVLVFPAKEGRFYDYENWGLTHVLRHSISQGLIQLFCVDSVDSESLYNRWASPADRISRHRQYEEYILNEVLPLTRAMNGNPFLIAHGCSFGAYHAMNLALRHPTLFGKVVALS